MYSSLLISLLFFAGCKKSDPSPSVDLPQPVTIEQGTIYHIDMESRDLYDLFMVTTLQGNVNREAPHIWIQKTPIVEYDGPGAMVDRSFWLNTINDKKKTEFKDPYLLVRDFLSVGIDGCVIYDDDLFGNYVSGARYPQPNDNLVAKLNVTAMLCAYHGAVALTMRQYEILKSTYGVELPILENTTTPEFDSWLGCYRYAIEVAYREPVIASIANNSHYCLGMFDFLIKNKMFIINMKGDPSMLEQQFTDEVFDRVLGPAPVYGIWNVTGGAPSEDTFMRYLNSRGKYCIPNFEAFNISYTSGFPPYVPEESETVRDLTFDPAKKYICFTETDGDNYEFIQQIFPIRFNTPQRGDFPIAWEIPSTLWELDPVAAKWFYAERGQNSYVTPVTGVGYYKYPPPEQYREAYFQLTDEYMKNARFRTIRTMEYSFESGRPLSTIPSVEGVFCGYGHDDPTRPIVQENHRSHELYNGKAIFINYSYKDMDDISAYSGPTPAFFSVACVYTHPSDIIQTINALPADWVVVSPGEMVDLYKQYRSRH
ncbi:GxGYxY sequence motif-containing protein [Parapedobacter luteus]|uniref:GxGYxY sequence motif-containing protein n=1 Tax=Parapedobacter luteus TaxID=623280 RepID=A0A1T4ZYF9_9SPHI|nr:GxGYxYP domain-containing protein [Parapedobacter luteus]SKB27547.1 GxGYxY sequence motif-containing protein [Parapedobacter luteus]